MPEKKGKYLTKQVKFGGVEFTLYSIDGVTWSSNKNELEEIHERHEKQRQVLIEDTREYLKREKDHKAVDGEEPDEGYSRPKRQASDSGENIEELDLHEVNEEEAGEEGSVKRRRGRPPKALQAIKGKFKGAKAPVEKKEEVTKKTANIKGKAGKKPPAKPPQKQKQKPQPKVKKAPAKPAAAAKKPVKKAAKAPPKNASKGKSAKRKK